MTNLIVFDFEGTLIKEELLVELGRRIGKENEIEKITRDGLDGKIDWFEGLRKRIDLLRGVSKEELDEIVSEFTFQDGVPQFVKRAKELGYKTAIVTGGFDVLADRVADDLKLDYCVSNSFVFEDGKLEDVVINVNCNKNEWLEKLSKDCGAEITISFGDGSNDIKMLKASNYGIFLKEKSFHIFIDMLENIKRCKNV